MRAPFPKVTTLLLLSLPLLSRSQSQENDNADLPTSELLTRANALLASGAASEALSLYSIAIERDPQDYLTLYRKATTHMSLGQLRHAADGFESVLKVREYGKARLQLGKIALKQGDFDKGEGEVGKYLKEGKGDKEGSELLKSLKEGRASLVKLQKEAKGGKWEPCVETATAALVNSPHALQLRQLRAECYLAVSNLEDAVGDLTRALQLDPNSRPVALRLSLLTSLFLSHPLTQSLVPIRQCLHSDPDSKPCRKYFKLLKSFDKDLKKVTNFVESGSWRSALSLLDGKGTQAGLLDQIKATIEDAQKPEVGYLPASPTLERSSTLITTLLSHSCQAHLQLGNPSAPSCTLLLARDPENLHALAAQGENLMKSESWEEAVRVLTQAFEQSSRQDRDIHGRLQRAQKGLKVSKQKDYYKVLGVARNAEERTLKKAYRKATLRAHPDKGGSEEKMAALNEAYEVLGNPELRARYDNGDDPNDHSNRGSPFQQGGGHMFQQFFQQGGGGGGNPFGGHGGQFSFRFG